ncbi:ClpX C4-type zinc finger protein [Bilophila wadsworthia]|uniref:ClpX C4-type zinc finger protein n=1 Tax=Bilophila wadsworthia TaxID=35833 RepID=UPI002A81497F|nr:ClpX C4-type zinc finger protein [Bilophila wadsworthia]MDY3682300.1 ClpX C4-type zinc finger protein [Bilophila wadsworthia]
MTTGTAKLTGLVCSFCGAGEEDCDILIENEDCTRYICNQCVKVLTAYLKANPGRKHLRYLPKKNKK